MENNWIPDFRLNPPEVGDIPIPPDSFADSVNDNISRYLRHVPEPRPSKWIGLVQLERVPSPTHLTSLCLPPISAIVLIASLLNLDCEWPRDCGG